MAELSGGSAGSEEAGDAAAPAVFVTFPRDDALCRSCEARARDARLRSRPALMGCERAAAPRAALPPCAGRV